MKKLKIILQSKWFYLFLIIFIFLYTYIKVEVVKYKSIYEGVETGITGQIIKIKKTDYGYSFTLKSKENLICYFNSDNFLYKLGDTVKVYGQLEKPNNNTIINNFNYKKYLYQNFIYYTFDVDNIELISKNENIFYFLKNKLIDYINNFKTSSYLQSFILGDTSSLNKNINASYLENGIYHLLAIGSTHILFLNLGLLFVLKKIKISDTISHLISFIIIFIYIIITDYPVSILRSYIYLIFSFFNKKLKLKLKPINIFILVLTINLLINPFYIFNKGFLYSYSISFILILNSKYLNGNYFKTLFLVSIIAFIYSIPLNIYYNYSLNLLSVLYNLFFVPYVNLIIFPLSLLTLIFPFLDNIFYILISFMENVSLYLNNYTWGIIIFKKINIIFLIIYFLLVTYVIKDILKKRFKSLIILTLVLIIHSNFNKLFKSSYVIFNDVNQGDSTLLHSSNISILIDTGGLSYKSLFENSITMFKSLGINKIDYLFLTHGDYDHMGEAINLVNNFKVEKVIFNCGPYNDLENELIKELDKKKIPYYSCIKGLNIDDNKLYFLNNKDYGNENDNSSVIYTELNNYKFLFMGDAGVEVEQDLIKKYNLQDIDVLKVGHHGSKTSSSKTFIDEVNPKYSIISVGKNNRYGHPNDNVLDNLEDSKIYRTDIDGSIIFEIKNRKMSIYSPS